MDDLVFPGHALEQMRKDGLTKHDVYAVVSDSDEKIERTDGRTLYGRLLDDARYVVVVIEDDARTDVSAWQDKRRSRTRSRRR